MYIFANHGNNISRIKKEDIVMKWIDNTSLALVITGAVNWLLVGLFKFDLVAFLFGDLSWLSRIVYIVIGLCGLYLISLFGRINEMK